MSKKVYTRLIIGVAAILILYFGYQWFDSWSRDPENESKVVTRGMIAAIEVSPNGNRAVVFAPDGKKVEAPAFEPGEGRKEDREISWGPTGAHVFISSNREGAFNIFRWNPVNNSFSRRSRGSRSQSAPRFQPDGTVDSLRRGLMIAGGAVQQLDPKFLGQEQILPPLTIQQDQSEGGGSVSAMSGAFGQIGDSIRDAVWVKFGAAGEPNVVYTVMRREGGEVLVVNEFTRNDRGEIAAKPQPILAGRRIVVRASADGRAVVGVMGFQWPDPNAIPEEFRVEEGDAKVPWENGLLMIPPPGVQEEQGPVAIFPPDQGFTDFAISPDGSTLAVVLAQFKGEQATPSGLFVMPVKPGGIQERVGLEPGAVSQPSFGPNSQELVFLKTEGGKRVIYVFSQASGQKARISDPSRDYRSPVISPQG